MKSLLKEIGPVQFPENTGERVYMLPFTKREGLPFHLSRWQLTIDAMLQGIDVEGPIYLMIDQGTVQMGKTHRRGGAHIDGNWNPTVNSHSGGGGGGGSHGPPPGKHRPGGTGSGNGGGWNCANFNPEALILASDVTASCAYVGEVEGEPAEGGDCCHIDLSNTLRVPLVAGKAYAGNVTMIHESLPLLRDCGRTLVRLNVPGYTF